MKAQKYSASGVPHADRCDRVSTLSAIGARLMGFDNAHPIREGSGPGGRRRVEYDHKHRGPEIRFYVYEDAAKLLADIWAEVEAIVARRSSRHGYS